MYVYTHTHIYILLALFLWRILHNPLSMQRKDSPGSSQFTNNNNSGSPLLKASQMLCFMSSQEFDMQVKS